MIHDLNRRGSFDTNYEYTIGRGLDKRVEDGHLLPNTKQRVIKFIEQQYLSKYAHKAGRQ